MPSLDETRFNYCIMISMMQCNETERQSKAISNASDLYLCYEMNMTF